MHHGKTYLLCAFVAAFGLLVTWKVCRPRAQAAAGTLGQIQTESGELADAPYTRAFVFSNESAADVIMHRSQILPASLGLLAPAATVVAEGLTEPAPIKPR